MFLLPLPAFIETNTLESALFTLRIVFTNFIDHNRLGDRLREVALEISSVLGTRGPGLPSTASITLCHHRVSNLLDYLICKFLKNKIIIYFVQENYHF